MITGIVNANHEATIQLIAQDAAGNQSSFVAVIDTGFTGFLTLPQSSVDTLGFPWLGRQRRCWPMAARTYSTCMLPPFCGTDAQSQSKRMSQTQNRWWACDYSRATN
jgi:hypothetical protein